MTNKLNGYTLIELMIALGLGLVITAAVVTAYVSSKENTDRTTDVSTMQETGRIAMSILKEDIAMAGFFGYLQDELRMGYIAGSGGSSDAKDPGAATILNPAKGTNAIVIPANKDCRIAAPMLNNATIPQIAPTSFSWFYVYEHGVATAKQQPLGSHCVSDAKSQSDIIQIKRVYAEPKEYDETKKKIVIKDEEKDKLYLVTEPQTAAFVDGATLQAGNPFKAKQVNKPAAWEYIHRVYYIQNQTNGPPKLVRRQLSRTAANAYSMVEADSLQEIVEGVEHIYIDVGFDTSLKDDRVDKYISADKVTNELWGSSPVVVARLFVLVRDLDETPNYKELAGERLYALGNRAPLVKNDNFKRQLFTTNILLYNGIEAQWYESSIEGK